MTEDFDGFYAAHVRALTAQLYASTGDLAEAQDIVQEAFCRAWSRWPRLAEYEDPLAWVRRVSWNLAMSRWRRMRTAARFLAGQRPEYAEGPSVDRVALVAALARLPVAQRRALILHYLAGLTTAELAQECGAAESTVRSWLHRGRTTLMTQLAEEVSR
ncbi:SigE family RNA polymerase sigma factor [Planosporangium mesophilum]|uniref:RNA polymerase sigma24 factor n=1 Tax=Planosporangium mesophilum TaxID=689768 RepID=A0A8J3TBM8_9ACTN|nr:SigE family RNA polymerase sigma factor [Planosporangium mesophilum]NJC84819.1 SigE family RNA polymerase sigma factor [Planosporangium mesophilum]GII24160.1 RNA polymerase sigma24 factor [Planosporangium mesophilum]